MPFGYELPGLSIDTACFAPILSGSSTSTPHGLPPVYLLDPGQLAQPFGAGKDGTEDPEPARDTAATNRQY